VRRRHRAGLPLADCDKEDGTMRLTDHLRPEWIKVPLAADTVQGAVEELVGLLAAAGQVSRPRQAVRAVLKRERSRGTAIGGGIALPHARTPAARELLVALGRASRPISFGEGEGDGEQADLIVLLLGPRSLAALHTQALVRISRLLGDERLCRRLRTARGARELYDLLRRREDRLDAAESAEK